MRRGRPVAGQLGATGGAMKPRPVLRALLVVFVSIFLGVMGAEVASRLLGFEFPAIPWRDIEPVWKDI